MRKYNYEKFIGEIKMRKFIALILMLSVFFTTTLSAATKYKVIGNPTANEYIVQEVEPAQEKVLSAEAKHAIIDFVGTLFIGEFGFHQFYNGHIGMGILYIFTGGLFGIGYVFSIIVTLVNFVEVLL